MKPVTIVIVGICAGLCLYAGVACASNLNAAIQSAAQSQDSQQNSAPASTPAKPETAQTKESSQSSPTSGPCSAPSQGATSATTGCSGSPKVAKAKRHTKTHKSAQSSQTTPTKTVVRDGGTTDPTVSLSPGVSQQEASRLQDTDQLLSATDTNLRQLAGRKLTASQQDTIKQIRSYMDQARQASKSGDLQRARNLAYKAELLSAQLAGP